MTDRSCVNVNGVRCLRVGFGVVARGPLRYCWGVAPVGTVGEPVSVIQWGSWILRWRCGRGGTLPPRRCLPARPSRWSRACGKKGGAVQYEEGVML